MRKIIVKLAKMCSSDSRCGLSCVGTASSIMDSQAAQQTSKKFLLVLKFSGFPATIGGVSKDLG